MALKHSVSGIEQLQLQPSVSSSTHAFEPPPPFNPLLPRTHPTSHWLGGPAKVVLTSPSPVCWIRIVKCWISPPPPRATNAGGRGGELLGAADVQTAHPATSSVTPAHQLLGSANAETTPAGALAAAADRTGGGGGGVVPWGGAGHGGGGTTNQSISYASDPRRKGPKGTPLCGKCPSAPCPNGPRHNGTLLSGKCR